MTAAPELDTLSYTIEKQHLYIIDLCNKIFFTEKIENIYAPPVTALHALLENRKAAMLPYVKTLAHKLKEDHNCKNCSGSCHIKHEASFMDIIMSAQEIEKELGNLDTLLAEKDGKEGYAQELSLLHSKIQELLKFEKEEVIPAIQEAKIKINAV